MTSSRIVQTASASPPTPSRRNIGRFGERRPAASWLHGPEGIVLRDALAKKFCCRDLCKPTYGAGMKTMNAAAIYARISSDQTGEGLGVQRQLEDCRRLALERGWTVAGEYIDN